MARRKVTGQRYTKLKTIMASTRLTETEQFFDIIQTRLALALDEHRRLEVLRAADELMATREIAHVQDLIRILSEQPTTHPFWQKVIQIATIGETYFFRDLDQLNALRYTVLPNLIEQRRKQGRLQLRLWSAGCSTGEEPYSLAILLRSLIPDIGDWNITILATDLNISNLERARTGIYRTWSFRAETPEEVRRRWFIEEQGNYRIDPSIRSMVTFAQLNLASGDYPSYANNTLEMDIIVCRNVLIYFDNLTTAATIARFQGALRPEGWLVLGHAEAGHMMNHKFQPHNFENAVIYQKLVPVEQPLPVTSTHPQTRPLSSPTYAGRPTTGRLMPIPVGEKKTAPLPVISAPADPLEQAQRAADREQWDEALRWLAEAEKKQMMRPEIHYLRGVVELHQKELDKALISLRRAIYCDNRFVLAHFVLGELYEKQGYYRKASYQWSQAQSILGSLPQEAPVAFSNDLTVEILSGLLQYRLNNLPAHT